MPELPWEKWYPTNWAAEPGLRLCEAATRGIWFEIINTMMLKRTGTISGTIEQLASTCFCRVPQMQLAIQQISQFGVGIVTTNGQQNVNIIIECRRLSRLYNIKNLRRQAGIASATKRQQTPQHPSASAYASASASSSPDRVTGEDSNTETGRAIIQELMCRLSVAFKRSPDSRWSYAEEAAAAEVARRPRCLDELDAILSFRKTTEFFPQSVNALLGKWAEVLDRSRNGNGAPPAPLWRQVQSVTDLISKHPANRESTFHNPKCTTDQKKELTELRSKLDELNNRMAGGSK